MSFYLEGKIDCTLVELDGVSRGEKGSVSFSGGLFLNIPDLIFPGGETLKFTLKVKEKETKNPLTRITERKREGQLNFLVFLKGKQRNSYTGGKTFDLHPFKTEQHFKGGEWDKISVNEELKRGRVGRVVIDLFLKITG